MSDSSAMNGEDGDDREDDGSGDVWVEEGDESEEGAEVVGERRHGDEEEEINRGCERDSRD